MTDVRIYENRVLRVLKDDAARLVTFFDEFGAPTGTAPYTAEENAAADERLAQQQAAANEATIRQRAVAALQANADFLALSAPTNADVLAQVRALTRQNNGLIRLVLRRFDSAG